LVLTLLTFCPPGPPDREKLGSAAARIDCLRRRMFMTHHLTGLGLQ